MCRELLFTFFVITFRFAVLSRSLPMATEDDSIVEEVTLFYPLGLKYLSGTSSSSSLYADGKRSRCRLYGLTPDTIRTDHSRSSCRLSPHNPNRIVLRRSIVHVAATFNLYVVVSQRDEATNVAFVQNMIQRFLFVTRTVDRARKDANDHRSTTTFPSSFTTSKRSSSSSSSSSPFHRTSRTAANGLRLGANESNRLELVMENLSFTVGSMYQLVDGLSKRLAYEEDGVNDYNRKCDRDSNEPPLVNTDDQIACNLYVWRLENEREFTATLKHLTDNSIHWSNVYNVPASMDDDVIRFSLDSLIDQTRRQESLRRERVVDDLVRIVGPNNARHMDASLYSDFGTRGSSSVSTNQSIERTYDEYRRCRRRKLGDEERTPDVGESDDATASIDLHRAFAFGVWCLFRNDRRKSTVLLRVNRTTFDRLCSSLPDLERVLAGNGPELRADLYTSPLTFLPSVVWDIETIARNPAALPRGTSSDEKIVSVAITIERSSLSSRTYSLVSVLVPSTDLVTDDERRRINALRLLDDGLSTGDGMKIRNPIVLTYRDERSLLVDFFSMMSQQVPLLASFLLVDSRHVHRYRDVASFLVGHNVVGYDFTFLHNRFVYYGMSAFASHLTRNLRYGDNDVATMYTFNDAQLCIDTLLFLMARLRNLSSFDLGSVLTAYRCDLSKGTLDARAIRFFYNALESGDETELRRLQYHTAERRIAYFRDYLVYNLYDCLSLASLLRKLAFPVFVDTTVKFFRQSLNVACYCGNSRLLPALFTADMLANGREILPVRPLSQVSLTAVDRYRDELVALIAELNALVARVNERGNGDRPKFAGTFAVHAYSGIDDYDLGDDMVDEEMDDDVRNFVEEQGRRRVVDDEEDLDEDDDEEDVVVTAGTNDEERTTTTMTTTTSREKTIFAADDYACGPYDPYLSSSLPYSRQLDACVEVISNEEFATTRPSSKDVRWLNPTRVPDFLERKRFVGLSDVEHDLLRVGTKNYIGGMNYADPCHVKDPVLMDYKSFYPSIIRHFQLDMNNVSVFTALKLLLVVGGASRLDELLAKGIVRLFDYTPEESLNQYVNATVFQDERFADIFRPARYARREWYEGIEIDSVQLLVCSSKLLSRRVLVVWRKTNGSAVSRIVTQALARRAVWKHQRKSAPEDKVLEARELMEKLLANVTYGYLNFCQSVIFSRPTAAAVTLLCRNTFSLTRFIVEARETLARFAPELVDRYRARVNYIDTDGCIVSLHAVTGENVRRQLRLYDANRLVRLATLNSPSSLLTAEDERSLGCDPTVDEYLRVVTRRKQRFVEIVNEMLDMEHVTLESEEENAVAASIFGRKKYTLLKLTAPVNERGENRLLRDVVKLKKTGFEKNAVRPLKAVYDALLYNVMSMNHLSGLNDGHRFVAKIFDHRSVLYALFDTLYEMWTSAIGAEERGTEETTTTTTTTMNRCGGFRVKDFAKRIPLNERTTDGKLSRFIDATLRDFQYDPGDRVHVIHVVPVDEKSVRDRRLVYDAKRRPVVVYDVNDSEIRLLDHVLERPDDFVPDLRLYLNSHLTYMYECVEGWKTLRGEDHLFDEQLAIEPIACSDSDARLALLRRVHVKSRFVSLGTGNNGGSDDRATGNANDFDSSFADNGRVCYLKSMSAIASFFFAQWTWDRVLRSRHTKYVPHAGHAHVWREMDAKTHETLLAHVANSLATVDTNRSNDQIDSVCPPTKAANTKPNDGVERERKTMRYCSPHMFLYGDLFARSWYRRSDDELVSLTKRVLFQTNDSNDDDNDDVSKNNNVSAVSEFLRSGVVLFKWLD